MRFAKDLCLIALYPTLHQDSGSQVTAKASAFLGDENTVSVISCPLL